MTDEIKVQAKSKKTKLIIAITAVVIAVLTIVAIVLASSNRATAKQVKEQLSLGEKYLSELQYEQAIAAYELAIEIDPKSVNAYLGLAEVYEEMGEFDKAIKVLEGAKAVVGDEDSLKRVEEKLKAIEAKKQEATKPEPTATPVPTPTPEPAATPELTVTPEPTVTPISGVTDSLKWTTNEDGGVTIQGTENEEITNLVIPEEIEGKKVTRIDYNAFYEYKNLVKVSLPKSLKRIGIQAFLGCKKLREIELKEGLQTIDFGAFAYCDSLECLEIPASVSFIAEGVFRNCDVLREIRVKEANQHYLSEDGILFNKQKTVLLCIPAGKNIQEYVIPHGVEEIGEHAFDGSNVSKVQFSSTVTRIGSSAFWNCHRLKDLVIPGHVTEIENDIVTVTEFSISEENPIYCSVENVIFSKDKTELIYYENGGEVRERYVVPEGTVKIREGAFLFSGLECIEIPASVVNIEGNAFGTDSGITIIAPAGSYAESYAIDRDIPVENE